MATVYEYTVRVVSAFRAYPPYEVAEIIKTSLEQWRCPSTGLGLESIEVKEIKEENIDE